MSDLSVLPFPDGCMGFTRSSGVTYFEDVSLSMIPTYMKIHVCNAAFRWFQTRAWAAMDNDKDDEDLAVADHWIECAIKWDRAAVNVERAMKGSDND